MTGVFEPNQYFPLLEIRRPTSWKGTEKNMYYLSIVPLSGGGGAKTVADLLPAVTLSDGLIGLSEKLVVDTQEHAAMNGRAITTRRVDLKKKPSTHSQSNLSIYLVRHWSLNCCIGAAVRDIYMHTLAVGNVTREALFS